MTESDIRTILEAIVRDIFEVRKRIDACLRDKATRVLAEGPSSKDNDLNASVWNDLGLFFLHNRMWGDAELVYRHMLETAIKVEDRWGNVHKGLPLYNMGIAQINQKNFDEGIQNVLRAYEEDERKLGRDAAKKELAFRLKEGFLEFTSHVVDSNYLAKFKAEAGALASGIGTTWDLMANMDDPEKLLFAKIMTSKKLVSFHDDIYTKVVLFDNLKNTCLILESNLRGRSKIKDGLSNIISTVFRQEPWRSRFETERNRGERGLLSYVDLSDFESKVKQIELISQIGPPYDFVLRNFLMATLVRNFTAHYIEEKINILNDPIRYESVFERVLFALLYALSYNV